MIKSIFSSIVVFILGLIGVEFTLRIINSDMSNYDIEMWKYARDLKMPDSILGHVHKPNSSAMLQKVLIKLNSKGMRSEKIDPNKHKIVFLGSSATLGWGVKYNEAYPTIINEYLKRKKTNFQVLNSSTGNYNAHSYVNNFILHQKEVKPKFIVINYFLNDTEILPRKSNNFILRNSQLAATLIITVKKLFSAKDKDLVSYYNSLYEPKNPGFLKMKEALGTIGNYAKINDVKVYLVMIPEVHLLKDYPFLNIHTTMRNLANENGFLYHDLLPVMKGKDIKEIQVMEGDSHPNARIHSLIAQDLIASIFNNIE